MLSDIEDGIVSRITTKLANAAGSLGVQKGFKGIPQPAVYVSVEEGTFTRVTSTTYGVEVGCFVDIVFSHLQSESQRRRGIYPILEGIVQTLAGQKLDLAIDPLQPKAFRNITTQEIRDKGLIAYELEMRTKFNVTRADDEAVTDLLKVGLNYYLTPGDETADASDTVTLSQ
jgi:hypothetical protein